MLLSIFKSPMFLMLLILVLMVFTLFFMWKKIINLESYISILQKKLNNKKNRYEEQKEREIFNTIDEIVMNNIFQDEDQNKEINKVEICDDEKCFVKSKDKDFVPLPEDDNILNKIIEETNTPNENKEIDLKSESDKATLTKKKLLKMNVETLKELCSNRGLTTEGTKNALIDRLLE